MSVVLDGLGLEGGAEEVTSTLVAAVEEPRVRAEKPLHPASEISFGSSYDQVDVIAHQAIREQPPLVRDDDPSQDDEEHLAIGIVVEDDLPAVAARKSVMEGVGYVVPRFSWHTG